MTPVPVPKVSLAARGLQDELENMLGVHVDVVTPRDLPLKFRHIVLAEAKPL